MAKKKKKETFLDKVKNNPVVKFIRRFWVPISTTLKIVGGALATVLLICIVCGFAFAGILGSYLEEDILPEANLVLEKVHG